MLYDKRNTDLSTVSAIILAGGRGTRISEYTKIIPKPMIKINGKPIITYIITVSFVKLTNSYNFNKKEWSKYYLLLFFAHLFVWNVTIFTLEKNLY